MKRRKFVFTAASLGLLNGCGVLSNLGKSVQRRLARVGILAGNANSLAEIPEIGGLKQGLSGLGYVDGKTIVFELRDANGNTEWVQ